MVHSRVPYTNEYTTQDRDPGSGPWQMRKVITPPRPVPAKGTASPRQPVTITQYSVSLLHREGRSSVCWRDDADPRFTRVVLVIPKMVTGIFASSPRPVSSSPGMHNASRNLVPSLFGPQG